MFGSDPRSSAASAFSAFLPPPMGQLRMSLRAAPPDVVEYWDTNVLRISDVFVCDPTRVNEPLSTLKRTSG